MTDQTREPIRITASLHAPLFGAMLAGNRLLGRELGSFAMQNTTKRPRVAAIGLNQAQIESIAPMCGALWEESSVQSYLQRFDWTETDITILGDDVVPPASVRGHVLAISPRTFNWVGDSLRLLRNARPLTSPTVRSNAGSLLVVGNNNEREVSIPATCLPRYGDLAKELARHLGRLGEPFPSLRPRGFPQGCASTLVETTSGRPVALRFTIGNQPDDSEVPAAIILALPTEATLAAWFRAFLADVYESDPIRVPQPPPRIDDSWKWHTPGERALATRIAEIEREVRDLETEHNDVKVKLAAATQSADGGIRRCIWADGDDLVAAVGEILTSLGFVVRDMDAGRGSGEPKREDLRLSLAGRSGWEAIAEVKGYTGGTKTSDSRQIREHRDRYADEVGHVPHQTFWIANAHRTLEPSTRPAPDSHVNDTAATLGALHVLATDLYMLWTRVARGELQREQASQLLIDAIPGLWLTDPPSPGTGM